MKKKILNIVICVNLLKQVSYALNAFVIIVKDVSNKSMELKKIVNIIKRK